AADLAERFAGRPLKSVALTFTDGAGRHFARPGEFVVTASGVEGSLIYACSHLLRDEIARAGQASFALDLLPGHTPAQVRAAVAHPRGSRSLSSHLRSRLGLAGVKMALLNELLTPEQLRDAAALAAAIKALPVTLTAPRPLPEAISSAGGVRLESLTEELELRCAPGLFCAGEMLDWEAPTGGYLLTAAMASGVRAARGMLRRLDGR
ncbi:MAG TPA: NAD(P)/FAD-dependent oxidoreductase, partial [Ottowia sp.]|nr:NAD(P)/FAD-dependent oxidoreductase [Ottowia sp.]